MTHYEYNTPRMGGLTDRLFYFPNMLRPLLMPDIYYFGGQFECRGEWLRSIPGTAQFCRDNGSHSGVLESCCKGVRTLCPCRSQRGIIIAGLSARFLGMADEQNQRRRISARGRLGSG